MASVGRRAVVGKASSYASRNVQVMGEAERNNLPIIESTSSIFLRRFSSIHYDIVCCGVLNFLLFAITIINGIKYHCFCHEKTKINIVVFV